MAATKKSKKSKVPGKDRFRTEVLERLQMIETKVDGVGAGIVVRALVDAPEPATVANVAIGQTAGVPFADLAVGITFVSESCAWRVKVGDESACEPSDLDDNEHMPGDLVCYPAGNAESVYVLDASTTPPTLHGPFLNVDFANRYIQHHVPAGQGYYYMANASN